VFEPDLGEFDNLPAILFDPTAAETLDLESVVPGDIAALKTIGVKIFFSGNSGSTQNIAWELSVATITPQNGELLTGETPISDTSGALSAPPNELRTFGGGGGTPNVQAGDLVHIAVTRNAALGSDTLSTDAAVLAVVITYDTDR